MTIPIADPLSMMERALRDVGDLADKIEGDSGVERKIRRVSLLEHLGPEPYSPYRKALEEIKRECQESLERLRRQFEAMLVQVQCAPKRMHRGNGRSSGTGKSTAKKSASASSGGDGGDSDGPARTRSKSKKSRSLKRSTTPTTHRSRSSLGAISTPSPQQLPPPSRSQGMAQLTLLYAINCVLIVVLLAMGERELASIALGSGSISALLNHLKDKPDRKD